jgi:hypothetical protein
VTRRLCGNSRPLRSLLDEGSAMALSAVASIAMIVNPATTVADSPDPVATEPKQVVVLPIRAHVARAGLVKTEEVHEWSALARANLDAAVGELVAQSSVLSPAPLPALSTEESNEIDEFVAVANLIATQSGGSLLRFLGADVLRATADLALGPSLAFLRDRTGADHALGTLAFQLEQSKRLAAAGSIASMGPLFGIPIYNVPTVSSSYVAMFIADLGTGELLWLKLERGFEVAGLNFSDLRDPDSVRKMVGELLDAYRDDPRAAGGQAARESAPTRPASPIQGGFVVRAPAGWTVTESDNVIRATRDGNALNNIGVELRDHNRSFLAIGRRTTRYTSPQQLAAWFVEDLEQQKVPELRIMGVSTDSQLVGKPAFRVRFSYRLPVFLGGARIEQVAIGTAVADGLLVASLDAPQLGYFAKAMPAFEEVVQTMVLKSRRRVQ